MKTKLLRTRSLLATLLTALPLGLLLGSAPAAQLRDLLPQKSPRASTLQVVGATELRVDYHRPAVRERRIWGALVPYGEVWRAGANETTTFTTSDPITVEGVALPPGSYGLHVIPREGSWSFILNQASEGWGSSGYDEARDVVRVEVTPRKAPHTESLLYAFEDVGENGATLVLRWEKLALGVRLAVDTPAIVLARIRERLAAEPTPENRVAAAGWCLGQGVALEEALTWVDQALTGNESFQALVVKAGLLDARGESGEPGDTGEVDRLMERALALSPPVGQLVRAGRQFQDRGRHALAVRLLFAAADAQPDSVATWIALGDSLAALGERDEALRTYARALALTEDETQITRIREASAKLEAKPAGH